MAGVVSIDDLSQLVGREVGPSDWVTVNQDRIDGFADVTEDHQFIHVDQALAAQGPFGTTIAHGFLTLSLLTRLMSPLVVGIEGTMMGINYGFDRVRFLAPVKSGSRVRAHAKVLEAGERKPGQVLLRYDVSVEIENEAKPALMAEWLVMSVVG